MNGFSSIFRGLSGDYENTRVLGSFGAIVFILGALGFQIWELHMGEKFDLVAWCTAFPGGLVGVIGAINLTAAQKEKTMAVAQTIRETGSLPVQPIGDGK